MIPNPFDLTSRIALVTGAARGLGHAVALGLARAGATVVFNGRDATALARAIEPAEREGWRADIAVFDVADEDAVATGIAAIEAKHGALDVLVNNAGIQRRHPIGAFPKADWDAIVATNLTAPFLCARAAIPGMAKRRRGSIINIASILGQVGFAYSSAYVAAKHGVTGLTRSAALAYASQGVRINSIHPGYVETAILANLDGATRQALVAKHAIGRLGRAEEIAHAVAFLLSDGASFLAGSALVADGGYTVAHHYRTSPP